MKCRETDLIVMEKQTINLVQVGEGGRNTWNSSDSSDNEFEHHNDNNDEVEFIAQTSTRKILDDIGKTKTNKKSC